MMMMMIMMIIIIIVIIIILLVVQVLSLLLLLLLLLLLSSLLSSFFCVSECFFNRCLAVWYPFCFSGQAVYPRSRPSNCPAVLLLSFIYLFILSTFTQSFLFYFFILFLLRSVAVRRVIGNKIRWYYFATKSTSKIVTNIFAHEINVIKRRGQIKKELFFVGSVWENICVNTDIGVKWQ